MIEIKTILAFPNICVIKNFTLCLVLDLIVNIYFNLIKNCEGAWTSTKLRRCNEEAVVEVDIHVRDDDVGVEKLPKNEKPQEMRGHQENSGRKLGLGLQFHLFWGKQYAIFHPSLVRHVYKIDLTKHTS